MADLERASEYSRRSPFLSSISNKNHLQEAMSKHDSMQLGSERRTKSISNRSRRSNKSIQDSVNRLREQSRKSSVGSRVAAASKHYERKPQLKTKENPFTKDVADIGSMNEALKSNIMRKTASIENQEEYDSFFKNGALIKLPPIQHPIVCVVNVGKSIFIAANDAHSKESNFGYSRNKLGGFYNH